MNKIVKFSANWCNPCKTIQPILVELSKELNVELDVIDIDDNDEMVEKYGIRSVPTTLFIKDNEIILKVNGTFNKNNIVDKLKELNYGGLE